MASNVITGQQWGPPAVGTRDGNWVWNGNTWICAPDCGTDGGGVACGPPVFSGPVSQPPWYPGANGGVSFGATAPANPVRGHMWWDGASFWLFDGAAWVGIGGATGSGGAATGTTPPANPFNGQQWFNGSVLYIWDGTAWVPTSTTKSYVQATAPPNPNPGDTWFDGTQQRIWSGSAWALVGPGATVGPVPTSTITFSMIQAANLSITPSVGTTFTETPFVSSPTIDTLSGWDPATKKYTPNKAGLYLVLITGWNFLAGGGAYAQTVLKNDQGVFNFTTPVVTVAIYDFIGAAPEGIFSATGIVPMNGTTDYLRHWSYSSNGTVYAATTAMPTFECVLLP
jgi:hypothetical protein